MSHPQLPLALRWPSAQRFDYFVGGHNATALAAVVAAANHPAASRLYLSGPAGSGKTHLLIAACAAASAAGFTVQYLRLQDFREQQSYALRDFAGSDVLCVDGLECVAGNAPFELALFDLFNRTFDAGGAMLFAARAVPQALGLGLQDLVSRLSSTTQFVLRVLDEPDRRQALRKRADARGLKLDGAVLDYLFTHYTRELAALTELLDRIDRESLASKRRVTVPFLRALLER